MAQSFASRVSALVTTYTLLLLINVTFIVIQYTFILKIKCRIQDVLKCPITNALAKVEASHHQPFG